MEELDQDLDIGDGEVDTNKGAEEEDADKEEEKKGAEDEDADKEEEKKEKKPAITSVGLKEIIKDANSKTEESKSNEVTEESKDTKADDEDEVLMDDPSEDIKEDDEKDTNEA